jgi:hypothetical protein
MLSAQFFVGMGGSTYKSRVNRCRKFVSRSLALPRGATTVAELLVMKLARKLALQTPEAEWAEEEPASWCKDWVLAEWDLLRLGPEEPPPPVPVGHVRPVNAKHLQDRASELFTSTIKDVIKKEAAELKNTIEGKSQSMSTLLKRVQWSHWRRLAPGEREIWVARLDSDPTCRIRLPTGIFAKAPIHDDVPLAALAPAVAPVEDTPKKRKPMGVITPEKFKQKELAQIGKTFLARVGTLLHDVPNTTATGSNHLLRQLATEIKQKSGSKRSWKGLVFSRKNAFRKKKRS